MMVKQLTTSWKKNFPVCVNEKRSKMNVGKSLKYETGVYQSCIESITNNDYRQGHTEALRIELLRPLRKVKQSVRMHLDGLTLINSLRFFTIIDFEEEVL